jgi:hypothetical protein
MILLLPVLATGQKKVYVRMIDTSGWGNNFVDTSGYNADLSQIRGELADTSAELRSVIASTELRVDSTSFGNNRLRLWDLGSVIDSTDLSGLIGVSTNIYTDDGTIDDAVRSVTLGSNDINFDANTLFIDGSADRVGILTNTPGYELHVVGSKNQNTATIQKDQSTTVLTSTYGILNIVNANTTNNNWGRINFTGDAGTAASGYMAVRFTDHTSDYGQYHFGTRGTDGLNTRMVILEEGNVGIGNTSPSTKLHVTGNARITAIGDGAYSAPVNQTSDGTLTTSTSDARWKRNIKKADIDSLAALLSQLEVVRFQWIEENEKINADSAMITSIKAELDSLQIVESLDTTGEVKERIKQLTKDLKGYRDTNRRRKDNSARMQYGLIAQQVQGILPEAVGESLDGYLFLRWEIITSALIASVQDQAARLDDMEKRLSKLEKK